MQFFSEFQLEIIDRQCRLSVSQMPRTLAYGSIALPNVCGHAELTCRTWRPLARGLLEEAVACMDGLGFWGQQLEFGQPSRFDLSMVGVSFSTF